MPADDFQWNDNRTRYRLRDYTLIIIEPEVAPVALINIMRSCLPRRLFFSTHEYAIRYSEAWARKWEQEIRLYVGNLQRAAALEAKARAERHASPPTWTSADEYRRRHGGNRNWVAKKAAAQKQKQD